MNLADMPITQFNQQAAIMQMQLMERSRLGQVQGNPNTQTGGVQDIGLDPSSLSRGQLRNQWEGALSCRAPQSDQAGPSDYNKTFGQAPYIKDFSSDNARALLSEAASAIGQSGLPGSQEVAQALAQGAADPKSVNQAAIKKLQSFLQSQGCPVGEAGTDGKLGPDTHKALMKFMSKKPSSQNPGPGNIPPGFTYVGRQDPSSGRFIPAGMERLERMQTQQSPGGANQYWA